MLTDHIGKLSMLMGEDVKIYLNVRYALAKRSFMLNHYNPIQVRELTSDGDCPHDFINLYDGVDEYSPLIGKFCGIGSFPVSIIGTSNKLFLEFVSSKYGPLINTGKHFFIVTLV